MKSNQSSRRNRGDEGEIGIGTMIVFIAAVIVAAIAAAVLVNTAGNLERKASETGQETTDEVSGNIFVRDIVGYVETVSGSEQVTDLNVTVALAPGANPLDLEQLHVQWRDDDNLQELSFQSSGAEADCDAFADGFCVLDVKEEEGSFDTVLEPGDRVHIHVGMDGDSEAIETRKDVSIKFMPETGSPVQTGFTSPGSYNSQTFVVLK